MPVSSFECQIARGQIGRYLDGGVLSPQAMKGLEEHLAECPDCKALVARRRTELLGQLGGEAPTHAVVAMPKENPLVAALRARAEESAPAEPRPASAPRYADKAPREEAKEEPKASRPRWKKEPAARAAAKESRFRGSSGGARDRSAELPNPSSAPDGRGRRNPSPPSANPSPSSPCCRSS